MVMIKLGILAMFILIAVTGFSTQNSEAIRAARFRRVSASRRHDFFTYVGLDAGLHAGEEVENPKKTCRLPSSPHADRDLALRAGSRDGVGRPAGARSPARSRPWPRSLQNLTAANGRPCAGLPR